MLRPVWLGNGSLGDLITTECLVKASDRQGIKSRVVEGKVTKVFLETLTLRLEIPTRRRETRTRYMSLNQNRNERQYNEGERVNDRTRGKRVGMRDEGAGA